MRKCCVKPPYVHGQICEPSPSNLRPFLLPTNVSVYDRRKEAGNHRSRLSITTLLVWGSRSSRPAVTCNHALFIGLVIPITRKYTTMRCHDDSSGCSPTIYGTSVIRKSNTSFVKAGISASSIVLRNFSTPLNLRAASSLLV